MDTGNEGRPAPKAPEKIFGQFLRNFGNYAGFCDCFCKKNSVENSQKSRENTHFSVKTLTLYPSFIMRQGHIITCFLTSNTNLSWERQKLFPMGPMKK